MGISTKTGDRGETDLIIGRRVYKDSPRMECLGTLDELNAFLGAARAAPAQPITGAPNIERVDPKAVSRGRTAEILLEIQKELIGISAIVAGGKGPVPGDEGLNALIDEFEAGLPPLGEFVIPGANPVSAHLHIARTLCRRAERRLVSLNRAERPTPSGEGSEVILPEGVDPGLLRYMNRLSDLLFLLALRES